MHNEIQIIPLVVLFSNGNKLALLARQHVTTETITNHHPALIWNQIHSSNPFLSDLHHSAH